MEKGIRLSFMPPANEEVRSDNPSRSHELAMTIFTCVVAALANHDVSPQICTDLDAYFTARTVLWDQLRCAIKKATHGNYLVEQMEGDVKQVRLQLFEGNNKVIYYLNVLLGNSGCIDVNHTARFA